MGTEVCDDLSKAILEHNSESAASPAKRVVKQRMDVIKSVDVMTEAIRQVGDAYGEGELRLSDEVDAGDATSNAMPTLDKEIKKTGGKTKSLDVAAVGTVFGNIT